MNIGITSINYNQHYSNTTLNKSKRSEMNFGHLEVNKPLKKVGFALFAASMLSLSSCIDNQKKQNSLDVDNQFDEITTNIKTNSNSNYEIDPKDYTADIDSFMNEDKSIVNVEIADGVDVSYANAYREILVRGYDKDGNLKRLMDIHPIEPTTSCTIDEIYCPEPEIIKTTFYNDKSVTESVDMGNLLYKETEYYNPVVLDGKSGYRYKEVEYKDGCVKTYTRGEADGNYAATKDYHKRIYMLDQNNKILEVLDFIPNENNEIILSE